MTGYGKASGAQGSNRITVEIKSLNSKFLELNMRLPAAYRDKDMELRNEITKLAERGKIDFTITLEAGPDAASGMFNKEIIGTYLKELALVRKSAKIKSDADDLSIVMRLPNVVNTEKSGASDSEWKFIVKLFAKAMKEFGEFRIQEGKTLLKDFELRSGIIRDRLKKIEAAEPARNLALKNRLNKSIEEISASVTVDRNRFEQELIYYMEKTDITEEKVRLKSHLDYFSDTLKGQESNGKKLGFILQEIGREINTIGSKANDAAIQRLVVEMKDELEKMKEQSANII